jgi:hypothetical protein
MRNLEIDGPNAIVLRDRKRAQSCVELATSIRDHMLFEDKLQKVDPDARHLSVRQEVLGNYLVHENECSLKDVVHFLARRIDGREPCNGLDSLV